MKTVIRYVCYACLLLLLLSPWAARGATPEGIERMSVEQQLLLAERASTSYLVASVTSGPDADYRVVSGWASAVVNIQQARAHHLSTGGVRNGTKTGFARAVDEAKKLGCHNRIKMLETQYAMAATEGEAERCLRAAFEVVERFRAEVEARSTFRRALPAWMGGTTQYAATTCPKRQEVMVSVSPTTMTKVLVALKLLDPSASATVTESK